MTINTDHKSLREKVYSGLVHEIIMCTLPPGSSLSEKAIADQYQVSKTPVREALTSLQQVGLVQYTPNHGYMVTSVSVRDVQEIFEARIFFEITFFRLAIASPNKIKFLPTLVKLAEIDDSIGYETEPELVIKANEEFHLTIARIAGNTRLLGYYQSLMNETLRLTYLDWVESNNEHTWDASHRVILDALINNDEEMGIQAIRDVLLKSKLRILGAV